MAGIETGAEVSNFVGEVSEGGGMVGVGCVFFRTCPVLEVGLRRGRVAGVRAAGSPTLR